MTLSADKAQREREAAVVEAANEIYNAQCDTGRTFDNSLSYEQIAAVIAKVEQAAFEAGRRESDELREVLQRAHLYFLQSNTLTPDDRDMLDEMWAALAGDKRGAGEVEGG